MLEIPGFYENLTGSENLQIFARLRGRHKKDSVQNAFKVVGLDKETKKTFGNYSLGMKQRLGIAAAEFSFFLAVPTMFGASAFKLIKFGFDFTGSELLTLGFGMVVAFVVSVIAIKFLMGYIKKHDFRVFGWYRIILGIIVLLYFGISGIM